MSDELTAGELEKCGSSSCRNAAEFYAAWPGQPMRFCEPCLERAKHIAEAMGFSLPWSRIKTQARTALANGREQEAQRGEAK